MQILKKQEKQSVSPTINHIVATYNDIRQYFSSYCESKYFTDLALELIREAIAARKIHAKDKHYNVAFVKHHRFLSPSQKQEVTGKVTEVIPVSAEKIKIFGKPKVRLDEGENCVQHQGNECPQNQKQNEQTYKQKETINQLPIKAQNQKQNKPRSKENIIDEQKLQDSQRYLCPKSPKQAMQPKINIKQKPTKTASMKEISSPNKQLNKMSQNTIKAGNLNIESHYRTGNRETGNEERWVTSPTHKPQACPVQKYDKVQSKIKYLIDQDRKNKKLQRKLQQQNQKIKQIQSRQQKLLLKQYEQQKQIAQQHQKSLKKIQVSCSCSSDDEITSKLMQLRQQMQGGGEQQQMRNGLFKKIEKLKDKTYKISTQPVYPLTSSSSSDLQDDKEQSYY